MNQTRLLIIMLGMAVITYAIRLSFFFLQDRVRIPTGFQQALRFAPAAVLMGLVAPSILFRDGILALNWGNERLLAAVLAGLVAWRTGNILLTIAGGMVALWLLQAVL